MMRGFRMSRLVHAVLCMVLALLALAVSAQAIAPAASLDRDHVRLGETVTLHIVVEGQNPLNPDLSALEVDFTILGRSTSTQLSIVGGQTIARTTWSVELEPQRAGILRIPPIPVGARATPPLALTVTDVPPAQDGEGEDIFLELEIEPRAPYVQQSVKMVLRLFYAVGLTEGNLREPEVEDATVLRVGQDRNYAAERRGRRYQVVERVFSVRPERSGTLRVGSAQFQGRAMRSDARRLLDPGVRVSARTTPDVLNVRARPAAAIGTWLPARSLHVEDELGPDPTEVRVGDPLTRTVRLYAEGLSLDQLPDLEHPEMPGTQVYADRPVGHGREAGGWQSAEREYRFAVVPGKEGRLELPEIRVAWWDVLADEPREAVLPARTVQVAPNPAVASVPPESTAAADGPARSDSSPPISADPGLWPWLSLSFGMLWLATLFGWWRSRPSSRVSRDTTGREKGTQIAAARLEEAVRREDAGSALSAVLAWARLRDPAIRHLGDLRSRIEADQGALLTEIERGRYAATGAPATDMWTRFGKAFKDGPRMATTDARGSAEEILPPLWPERS